MIDLFFISSLEKKFLLDTIKSFFSETNISDIASNFIIRIVEDNDPNTGRYEVLNEILLKRNSQNDLLIVADDIIFTKGWFDNLVKNLEYGDIIGFSMIKPGKDVYSNRGFEFVEIGKKISYVPVQRGGSVNNLAEEGYVECDAITGCLMYIKKDVLDTKIKFEKEGFNRWEELIFCLEAKYKGFKVIALKHAVYHWGISTKRKNNELSSISYSIEKKLWDKMLKTHGGKINISKKRMFDVVIDKELKTIMESDSKKLIIGAGTVAEYIIDNTQCKNVDIASGLKEEEGIIFKGFRINNFSSLERKLQEYEIIIISALGYENIFVNVIKNLNKNYNNILFLQKDLDKNKRIILIKIKR